MQEILARFVGLCIGVVMMTIVGIMTTPSGTPSKTKECLEDYPSICRDITTYTTEYKETK